MLLNTLSFLQCSSMKSWSALVIFRKPIMLVADAQSIVLISAGLPKVCRPEGGGGVVLEQDRWLIEQACLEGKIEVVVERKHLEIGFEKWRGVV